MMFTFIWVIYCIKIHFLIYLATSNGECTEFLNFSVSVLLLLWTSNFSLIKDVIVTVFASTGQFNDNPSRYLHLEQSLFSQQYWGRESSSSAFTGGVLTSKRILKYRTTIYTSERLFSIIFESMVPNINNKTQSWNHWT